MHHGWRPVAAGVLSLVAGALSVTCGTVLIFAGGLLWGVLTTLGLPDPLSILPLPVLSILGIPLMLLGATSIAGGSCALRRRIWPLALAGAICALFIPRFTILGVLATVFVVLGKDEFN